MERTNKAWDLRQEWVTQRDQAGLIYSYDLDDFGKNPMIPDQSLLKALSIFLIGGLVLGIIVMSLAYLFSIPIGLDFSYLDFLMGSPIIAAIVTYYAKKYLVDVPKRFNIYHFNDNLVFEITQGKAALFLFYVPTDEVGSLLVTEAKDVTEKTVFLVYINNDQNRALMGSHTVEGEKLLTTISENLKAKFSSKSQEIE